MRIRIRELEFEYNSIPALKGISIDIGEEFVAIVGPNGSGKTTLLKCMCKILKPKKGVVMLNGRDINDLSQMEIAKRIGYVPQNVSGTFPAKVFEVVLTGRRPYIGWKCSRKDLEKASEVLRVLGLEELAMRDFDTLSGGQQQKVLIARALAQEVEILLLDEPTANLDLKHQLEVMELLKSLTRKGVTVITAIHDLNLASMFADRIVMMRDGEIFAIGTPKDVVTSDNVRAVYGVEVRVLEVDGYRVIVPVKG